MLSKYKSLIAIAALGFATLALADAPPPGKEAREKMAQAHEKMAACLRSDRAIADCHGEMMKACKENMGEHGCGMGGMGGKSGKGGMGMMDEHHHPAEKTTAPTTTK